MELEYSPGFVKNFKKAPRNIQVAVRKRLAMFVHEPNHRLLRNHPLSGSYASYRSINVTGDWRVIYKPVGKKTAYLVAMGTHRQLYG